MREKVEALLASSHGESHAPSRKNFHLPYRYVSFILSSLCTFSVFNLQHKVKLLHSSLENQFDPSAPYV